MIIFREEIVDKAKKTSVSVGQMSAIESSHKEAAHVTVFQLEPRAALGFFQPSNKQSEENFVNSVYSSIDSSVNHVNVEYFLNVTLDFLSTSHLNENKQSSHPLSCHSSIQEDVIIDTLSLINETVSTVDETHR